MTEMNGGSFISGFASGALSSIASSAFSWDGNGATTKGLGWASSVRESTAGMIAFGTVMGGAGAALTGGNFWQGAVTGLIVSGLNHAMHQMSDDNGYDKNGKKINNNGGDDVDYKYDDNGNITDSKLVSFVGAIPGNGPLRGYGFKGFAMASGAVTENNVLFDTMVGGAVVKGGGALFSSLSSKSASLVLKYSSTLNKGNWWRLGEGFNPSTGLKNIRLAWGAHPDYLNQVPKMLQGLNTTLRNFAEGHIHFPNWKP